MALIDFFKVNQAPPDYVPTLQIGNDGHKQFIYDEFIKGHKPDFFYVPFHENAIDCCEIISSDYDAVSYSFTGCLMVVWQEVSGKVFVGHVATDKNPEKDCKPQWEAMKSDVHRWLQFRPSDAIPQMPEGVTFVGCYGLVSFDKNFKSLTGWGVVIGSKKDGKWFVLDKRQLLACTFDV